MHIFFTFFLMLVSIGVFGQGKGKMTRVEYIGTFKELAMKEMRRAGIPASITLAQGILESGDGNSSLAVKANNHFGIKCHGWDGPSVKHHDDKRNECFRKYRSPEKSYIDHSDFLKERGRYSALFELKPDDYKGWARGLKKAGYATSPTYASALIKLIEDNELYQYDDIVLASGKSTKQKRFSKETYTGSREILYNNRVKYILADSGDTYESISEEMYMFSWQLPKYNERKRNDKLNAGDLVYLQPKRNKASLKFKTHMVSNGETLYSISQKYGVKVEKLEQRNHISANDTLTVGSAILLRGKIKDGKLPIRPVKIEQPQEEEKPEFEVEFDLGG